jgi:hypothetical protein
MEQGSRVFAMQNAALGKRELNFTVSNARLLKTGLPSADM